MINLKETCDWAETAALIEKYLSESRDFMTDKEIKLKKKLIALLKDDGKGHHHAKYAARLAKFNVNIVPVGKEPSTAAISFDDGIIYINEGFLRDPKTFYQLNVLMRHELCHNLLMHQIRMMKHITSLPWSHVKMSSSIHELLNIIEDFEISNKKYSAEDKQIVRNMWLNGKLISGLVTEDHRDSWIDMTVEEMYDAILKEMDTYGAQLQSQNSGNLSHAATRLNSYRLDSSKSLYTDIKDFITSVERKWRKTDKDAKFPDEWRKICDDLQKGIVDDPNNGYTPADVQTMLNQVTKSKPFEKCDIYSPATGEVLATAYTPEEKNVAVECLKIIGGYTTYDDDYKAWYAEMTRVLTDESDPISKDELRDILKDIEK